MRFTLSVLTGLFFMSSYAQDVSLKTALNSAINETSGLLFLEDKIITHNDSGGANELYEISPLNGTITRTITISNASNVDWEDLAADDTHIYIADFGNNTGSRTDLKIYKILRSDFFSSNTVTAEIINFSYNDQTDFTPNPGPFFSTNYDAEALINFNDNLFIFTKQWSNENSAVYLIPKAEGTYGLDPVDSIKVEGLITGGTASSDESKILLTGYSNTLSPFIFELEGFSSGIFSNGSLNKYNLELTAGFSPQIEAISIFEINSYYISSEALFSLQSGLFELDFNSLSLENSSSLEIQFSPNPTTGSIQFSKEVEHVNVYNMSGQLLVTQKTNIQSIDLSHLSNGVYILHLIDTKSDKQTIEKLIIN